MAITSTVESSKLRLADVNKKTLCTYTGIDSNASADNINTFVNGVNALRKDTVSHKYLVVESGMVFSGITEE